MVYVPGLFCTDELREGILCGRRMVCWLSCFLLELLLWQQSFPRRFGRHLCARPIDWWKSVSLQAFTDDVIIIDLSVGWNESKQKALPFFLCMWMQSLQGTLSDAPHCCLWTKVVYAAFNALCVCACTVNNIQIKILNKKIILRI